MNIDALKLFQFLLHPKIQFSTLLNTKTSTPTYS